MPSMLARHDSLCTALDRSLSTSSGQGCTEGISTQRFGTMVLLVCGDLGVTLIQSLQVLYCIDTRNVSLIYRRDPDLAAA
jgi:hypothetical protein